MKDSGSGVKKILVVEDESAICLVCQRVLTLEGFVVDIAASGQAAQNMIVAKAPRTEPYDLCLIDIRTPVMTGKELYQWLKEKHPQVANGVIFTTGDVMGRDTESFLKQSGRLFLPKPFTPDELRTIVKEALKRLED